MPMPGCPPCCTEQCVVCEEAPADQYKVVFSGVQNGSCNECADYWNNPDGFILDHYGPRLSLPEEPCIYEFYDGNEFLCGDSGFKTPSLYLEIGLAGTRFVQLSASSTSGNAGGRFKKEYEEQVDCDFVDEDLPYSSAFGTDQCDWSSATCTISAV